MASVTKSVLGNDPFQRGAAPHAPQVSADVAAEPAAPRKPGRAPRPRAPAAPTREAPPLPEPAALAPASSPGTGALGLLRGVLAQATASVPLRQAVSAATGSYRAVLAGFGAGHAAVDAYGEDRALVDQLSPIADFLHNHYWRVKVHGASSLPSGAAVLVANHSGALPYDGPVLKHALGRERPDLAEARWLVEDQVFFAPFFGKLLNRLGAVRASPENALRLLSEERPVIVFPEGIHGLSKPAGERYQLRRFGRGGFVKIALRSGAPIVPVAVVGAEEATPLVAKLPFKILGLPYFPVTPLGPIPLPSRWCIAFGQPIDVSAHGADGAEDVSLVQELADQTRAAIQAMLTAALAERGSAFSG
jgi:1-acyl-sn-glycerol-3-phosphate acyltransferase